MKRFTEINKKDVGFVTAGSYKNNSSNTNETTPAESFNDYIKAGILIGSLITAEIALYFMYSQIQQFTSFSFGLEAPPASVTPAMLAAAPVFLPPFIGQSASSP